MTTTAPGPAARPAGAGLGGLLRHDGFRAVLTANVLSATAFGASRFVFVWLVGELTDWNPATAILGIVIGLPPLFLSAWAGALTDRLSPRRLGPLLFGCGGVLFAGTALLVSSDAMTVPLAMVCALVTSVAPSMLIPMIQALVPSVVPEGRLMQAVALQNLSMMVSTMGGIFVGGAVMQAFGTAAGFVLLTVACAIGAMVTRSPAVPERLAGASDQRGTIRDGLRIALRNEPLRSLLGMTAVFGIAIATSMLLLPEFARDVLGQQSLKASLLNVFMSVGMMTTSMVLATRWSPRRPGWLLSVLAATALGLGLVAIGSSRTYWVTAVACVGWGLFGGVAMTMLRTLTQASTPPEVMGRIMGLAALAQNGVFPLTAVLLFGLVAGFGVATSMVLIGVLCCVLMTIIGLMRPHVRAIV